MSIQIRDVPFGVRLLQSITDKCCPRLRINRDLCYRSSVLFLTYIAYMCYHLSRKPISVVKNVLHQNTQNNTPQINNHLAITINQNKWRDWAPFDGSDESAAHLLGTLDSAFLFAYAIAMFFSGFIAERINLRYFLSIGMIGSGIFCYLFGIARTYEIHSFSYFVFVQIAAGIFQTTGWPGVLAILGKWFGKTKRGLLFGIWNSHTSVGNILGSLIAGEYVEDDWGLSFIVPGLIIAIAGFMLFLFLVTEPADVGCTIPEHRNNQDSSVGRPNRRLDAKAINHAGSDDNISSDVDDTEILIGEQDLLLNSYNDYSEVQRRLTERTPILRHQNSSSTSDSIQPEKAIGFIGACRIPGVIEFSLSLFFAKLVSYTFLYWLPLYISSSTTLGAKYSADISTLFDVGGIVGAIVAGVISDQTGMSATTCVGMLIAAAPSMLIYQKFGTHDLATNMFLLIIVGVLVNGPYALITTAVSAELGTHSSLEGNQKALATVTAIIDGTGSIGAAVGPLLAAFVSSYGWHNVFYMLIVSDLLALLLLLRLFKHEVQKFKEQRRLA